jgi:hypothetical protein
LRGRLIVEQTQLEKEISMWIQGLFKSLTSKPTRERPIRHRCPASRLRVEALEDRWVPSFALPVDYAPGMSASFLVAADFNGDGRSHPEQSASAARRCRIDTRREDQASSVL